MDVKQAHVPDAFLHSGTEVRNLQHMWSGEDESLLIQCREEKISELIRVNFGTGIGWILVRLSKFSIERFLVG